MGAGSNLLISENIQNRIFIKLGKNFNKISLTKDNIVIAGCSNLDKNVSDFACEKSPRWPGVLIVYSRIGRRWYSDEFRMFWYRVQRCFNFSSSDGFEWQSFYN